MTEEVIALPFPAIERRRNPSPELMELIRTMHEEMKAIASEQKAFDAKLSTNMQTQTDALASAVTKLMTEAFPEGDPGGHRRHHELVIKRAEEQAEFWAKMRLELAKWGLIGFLGWVLLQLWNGFLAGPPK